MVIESPGLNAAVGLVSLYNASAHSGYVYLAVAVDQTEATSGLGLPACGLMVERAFAFEDYRKVYIEVPA